MVGRGLVGEGVGWGGGWLGRGLVGEGVGWGGGWLGRGLVGEGVGWEGGWGDYSKLGLTKFYMTCFSMMPHHCIFNAILKISISSIRPCI